MASSSSSSASREITISSAERSLGKGASSAVAADCGGGEGGRGGGEGERGGDFGGAVDS